MKGEGSKDKSAGLEEALADSGGVEVFRRALVDWFVAEGRDYPWRRTRDPYAVLVSEAMLQQTQISAVLERGYYERWMRLFPTWEALAVAPEPKVLKCWEGLGYYNRARNLQKAALAVCERHGGRVPGDLDALLALPGVGRYTAGAVMSFAFERRAPLVDGNVARVLARCFACEEEINSPAGLRRLWAWAEALVPEEGVRFFNSGLMELGQRLCRPTQPDCGNCPVADACLARRRGEVAQYPRKRPAVAVTARKEHVVFALRSGKVYLCRENGTRRRGLWRLPEIAPESAADLAELARFDYAITRYRVDLQVCEAPLSWDPAPGEGAWFDLADGGAMPPLGAPYRKALERCAVARRDGGEDG